MIIETERLILENQLIIMSVLRRYSDDEKNEGHVAGLSIAIRNTKDSLFHSKSSIKADFNKEESN